MQRLKTALTSWRPSAAPAGDPVVLLGASWKHLVGEDIAANSRPSEILRGAIDRFRDDIGAARRAKAAAGWHECADCGTFVPPRSATICKPCEIARRERRAAVVARMLFEVPFLGYRGIADHVAGLSREEYD